eukprot:COSAG01_NODE_6895_length_3448_cov_3.556285_1_plen_178_part_00
MATLVGQCAELGAFGGAPAVDDASLAPYNAVAQLLHGDSWSARRRHPLSGRCEDAGLAEEELKVAQGWQHACEQRLAQCRAGRFDGQTAGFQLENWLHNAALSGSAPGSAPHAALLLLSLHVERGIVVRDPDGAVVLETGPILSGQQHVPRALNVGEDNDLILRCLAAFLSLILPPM